MAIVLLIGSGGRESALASRLVESDGVESLIVAPGNPAIRALPKASCNSTLPMHNQEVVKFCKENSVDLVVVGPEDPLAQGLADSLEEEGIKVFGPKKDAARIETSKEWAKNFMRRHSIPTADYEVFSNSDDATEFLQRRTTWDGFAIKASGLAGGKGVIVASDREDAIRAIHSLRSTTSSKLKDAASTIIIEEKLSGYEISVLAFSDGSNVRPMPPAQDHKRRFGGGMGPNTGGMGAYCPCPLVSDQDFDTILVDILQKAVSGMKEEGCPFVGVLYAGLMMTKEGPKVLEYNCRFGDPETQILMLLLNSDLYAIMKACVKGNLDTVPVNFLQDKFALSVSVVVESYPGSVQEGLGFPIRGVEDAESDRRVTVFVAGAKSDENEGEETSIAKMKTNGGRVLSVCGVGGSLEEAFEAAYSGTSKISFEGAPKGFGAAFRKDIGFYALKTINERRNRRLNYKDSGVDIDEGNRLVEDIKKWSRATVRSGVRSELGMFGAAFDVALEGYDNPVLISGTDGVGTKLKIATKFGEYETIGEDLVAMCANDIIVHGAEPLFFLDYLSFSKISLETKRHIIKGISNGCILSKCSLIGGETAEMPGMYEEGELDMAGFCVGAVSKKDFLPYTNQMKAGNIVIGVASSGLHSNGFSLIRKIVQELNLDLTSPAPFNSKRQLGKELLTPTVIYTPLLEVLRSGSILGAAHITGGGIKENLARILPQNLTAQIKSTWNIPPVFGWLSALGVSTEELVRTFNLGVGFILIAEEDRADEVISAVKEKLSNRFPTDAQLSPLAFVLGTLIPKTGKNAVEIDGLNESLLQLGGSLMDACPNFLSIKPRIRVAVLISGTGTNLQALLDHSFSGLSVVEICLVISNVEGVQGLRRAADANVPSATIPHKNFTSRSSFENEIEKVLRHHNVEIVCLAGFMRILTGEFTSRWKGRLLNIHPSLLPAFKGKDAQKQALEAQVCVTGCTVHFVSEEVDAGAVIAQEAVPILVDDSVHSLSERIRCAEHRLYPRALELVARKRVILGKDGKIERY